MNDSNSGSLKRKKKTLSKKNMFNKKDYIKLMSEKSYEQAMEEIDCILNNLQNEDIPLDKMSDNFIKGNILFEHCQSLLSKIENDVIEITYENL